MRNKWAGKRLTFWKIILAVRRRMDQMSKARGRFWRINGERAEARFSWTWIWSGEWEWGQMWHADYDLNEVTFTLDSIFFYLSWSMRSVLGHHASSGRAFEKKTMSFSHWWSFQISVKISTESWAQASCCSSLPYDLHIRISQYMVVSGSAVKISPCL